MYHSPKSTSLDVSNMLTFAGAVLMIIAGIFAPAIPILRDQGSATRPGMIIGGVIICLIVLLPALKNRSRTPPSSRR